jgi:hypothetical protein
LYFGKRRRRAGTGAQPTFGFCSLQEHIDTTSGVGKLVVHLFASLAELQTIVLDFACTGVGGGTKCQCGSNPCVDPALDAANTHSSTYWSATSDVPNPGTAWDVAFDGGSVDHYNKTNNNYVRAVRGGW